MYTGIHGRPQRVEGSFTKRKNNEHGSVSDNTCGEDVGTGIADKQHSLNTQWISAIIPFGNERIRELFEQKQKNNAVLNRPILYPDVNGHRCLFVLSRIPQSK